MKVKDVIERYYEYANAGAWDEWCDLFAEDMSMDEQLAGHIEGRATLRSMMAGFPDMYASFANHWRHILVDGNKAAAVSHITAKTPGGQTIEAEVMNYFELHKGQIVYMANFHDSAPFQPVTGGAS
jgi:ketosteroid isomerase-like protein